MDRLGTHPKFQAFDSNGDPLSGGKLYTYEAGNSTPKTTYKERGLSTPNANPVVLDSRGECVVYFSGTMKMLLKTSADVEVWSMDNLKSIDDTVLSDDDGDTMVQVEESADEDKIRLDTGGTERALISGTCTETYIKFNKHSDLDGDTLIQVEEAADEDKIRFDTGGTERAVLDSTGLELNVILDLISGQLAFPATAVPSAGANTLDDYEEGTWTPIIQFGGANVGITYGTQAGLYTKVGRKVTCTGYIVLTSKGTSTGAVTLSDLPFVCQNNDGAYASVNISHITTITFANIINSYIGKNTTFAPLEETTEGGALTTITEANFDNASELIFEISYFI